MTRDRSEVPNQHRRRESRLQANEDAKKLSELSWSPLPEVLTGKQRAYLKRMAHGTKPVVIIGQEGVTRTVIGEIRKQLLHHELIKVKWASLSKEDGNKKEQARELAREVGAHFVQLIGQNVLLYRQLDPSVAAGRKRLIELPSE